MTVADVIVVHFAFGSPFGVYQITRGVRSTRSAASIVAYFVFWPLFAAAFVRAWFLSIAQAENTTLEARVEAIRTTIEESAFSKDTPASIFEFREIFARYTGLTIALIQMPHARRRSELLDIGRHGNTETASACFARREQRRMTFHQAQAAAEFEELVEDIARSQPNGDDIRSLTGDLAYMFEMSNRDENHKSNQLRLV